MADVPHYNAVYIGHAHTHAHSLPNALCPSLHTRTDTHTETHPCSPSHVPPHTKLKRMSPDAALTARVTQAVVIFFYSYTRVALPQF